MGAKKNPTTEIEIDANTTYTAREICRRFSWGPFAWQSAKRKGLKAFQHGGRTYVRGADVLAFQESLIEQQSAGKPNRELAGV